MSLSGPVSSSAHERTLVLGNDLAYDERPELLRDDLGHPTEAGGTDVLIVDHRGDRNA